jgi:hypothetical protein
MEFSIPKGASSFSGTPYNNVTLSQVSGVYTFAVTYADTIASDGVLGDWANSAYSYNVNQNQDNPWLTTSVSNGGTAGFVIYYFTIPTDSAPVTLSVNLRCGSVVRIAPTLEGLSTSAAWMASGPFTASLGWTFENTTRPVPPAQLDTSVSGQTSFYLKVVNEEGYQNAAGISSLTITSKDTKVYAAYPMHTEILSLVGNAYTFSEDYTSAGNKVLGAWAGKTYKYQEINQVTYGTENISFPAAISGSTLSWALYRFVIPIDSSNILSVNYSTLLREGAAIRVASSTAGLTGSAALLATGVHIPSWGFTEYTGTIPISQMDTSTSGQVSFYLKVLNEGNYQNAAGISQLNLTANVFTKQNATFDVPAIGAITVDGSLSDWSDSTEWSNPYILWHGTGLTSTTKAKFAWNDANDKLYMAIQTTEDSFQVGGHPVVGYSKDITSVPTSGIGSTQLAFDYNGTTVSIMNEIYEYQQLGAGSTWGPGTTDGVIAACLYNSADGTYTYELALPLWNDWRIGEAKVQETLTAGNKVFLYSVMEQAFNTGNGTNLTWNGSFSNPSFYVGAFDKAATLTLVKSAIPGDFNGDDVVNATDIDLLYTAIVASSTDNIYDLDGSGVADRVDMDILITSILRTAYGDANLDKSVDVGDLGILAANYGTSASASTDWAADYAKAFGTKVADDTTDDAVDNVGGSACSGLGLPLVAGLALMGLMLVKLEE